MNLEDQIQSLPTSPGVYLMKDQAGTVLYIGKAKNLRSRVRTYFGKSGDARLSLRFLMPKVRQVETFLTDTEKEALILENTLIKKHKPRHNIDLKDDKTYFSLRFNLEEEFPKLTLVRKIKRDGARYFGPYASSAAVKETLRVLRHLFPLRTCNDANFRNRSRPCLNFQIKKCLGPCCGMVSSEKYADLVQEVILFLEGKNSQLIKLLQERMTEASEALNFEEAARLRDQIAAIEQTLEKQKAVSQTPNDQDVFAFHRRGNAWEFQVLFFRRGILVGNKAFHFPRLNLPEEEALSAFLRQYYAEEPSIPHEILLPLPIEDERLLAEWLSEKKGVRVEVHAPQRGEKKSLVEMAGKNAENSFQKRVGDTETLALILQELKEKLRLKTVPHRAECFDISNLFGTLAVGSMVSFLDGRPEPSHYRHFKVHAPSFPDDYAMMYEILRRRYGKLEPGGEKPNLLIVDGGKGQLNVALAVLAELGLQDISAVGLAKDKGPSLRKIAEKTADKVYLPNVKDPVLLGRSASLRYLQRIRDEAHRFAIRYHKKLRGKHGLRTLLDDIPGIGEVKKKALLKEFGSPQKIQEASPDRLSQVGPMTHRDAQTVFEFFHPSSPAASSGEEGEGTG
ncbi:MAG TPA: excinuclease ABC subunit UvrC [Thermodesulfobacteriota bacterium]|nr:excinuclease ABC subunit UvrC [Thermodesulfobacteriota bacterium]